MKKFLGIMLSFVMAFSLFSFVGCDSSEKQSYIDKIALLEQQLKDSGADEVIKLKAKVENLESIINSTTIGNEALKTQLNSLNSAITTLSEQLTAKDTELLNKITELEKQLSDKTSGNVALLAKINELQLQLDSSDTAALKTEIDQLKAKYDSSESGNVALKAQIDALTSKLNDPVTGNAALNALITKLTTDLTASQGDITALTNKITALETTIGSDSSGLIKQLADLTKVVNQTKESLDTANTEITKLKTDVTGFETRIAMLESLQMGTATQKIYTVCEDADTTDEKINTYTFVNNNTGAKLFSIKLTKYYTNPTDKDIMVTITNHSIPDCVPSDTYFTIYAYKEGKSYKYSGTKSFLIKANESKSAGYSFTDATEANNATHFIIGIPTQDSTKQSIIPYATFKL